ncbi:MAG: cytochrome c peroxidase [Bacteroidota bacterium]
MKRITFLLLSVLFLGACTQDELINPLDGRLNNILTRLSPDDDLSHFVLPASDDYDAIPNGAQNPITQEKVELGKFLFYETGLARKANYEVGNGTFSCATCHVPSAGFTPGREQGIADGGLGFGENGEGRDRFTFYAPAEMDVQGARPISLLNVAYQTNTSWSGKFGANYANVDTEGLWDNEADTEINHLGLDGLESQNIEGLKIHRMDIDDYVLDDLGYRDYFDKAFEDWETEDRYSLKAASFAISAYLRTLITNEAPFQDWLKGNAAALSDMEKRGAIVFFNRGGCYRCHKGPGLSSTEFYALGVKDLYETGVAFNTDVNDKRNLGRGGFTGRSPDMFAFKVPGIYNMSDVSFYFHGSSKRSLEEVVEYFNDGIPENENVPLENISYQFRPLGLTEGEKADLVAFLENGLRDPNLERYVPEQILSGNCFPNNDPDSQSDLGCN